MQSDTFNALKILCCNAILYTVSLTLFFVPLLGGSCPGHASQESKINYIYPFVPCLSVDMEGDDGIREPLL